jgi:hypothetical protein
MVDGRFGSWLRKNEVLRIFLFAVPPRLMSEGSLGAYVSEVEAKIY